MPLLLTDQDVGQLLTMEDAVDAVEEAFRLWHHGEATMDPRFASTPPNAPGRHFLRWLMPCTIYGLNVMGAKLLISATPGTEPRRPADYAVLLFDARDGSLMALVQGPELSRIRTGAVTAVGTKYLARESSETLGVFGSAEYAPMQLVGVCAVRPIKRVKVFSPTREHRLRFAQDMERLIDREVVPVESSQEAVVDSDIIVTVTNSTTPVFDGAHLRPGTHIAAAGSSIPNHRETDDLTVRRSKIVVEYMDQALREAGDLVIPMNNGVIGQQDIYAEIAEIIGGAKPGRVSDEEITLFKFNGIAIEDVACAMKVYQRAQEKGIGQW